MTQMEVSLLPERPGVRPPSSASPPPCSRNLPVALRPEDAGRTYPGVRDSGLPGEEFTCQASVELQACRFDEREREEERRKKDKVSSEFVVPARCT